MKFALPLSVAATVLLLAACAPKQDSELETVRARVKELLPSVKAENIRPAASRGLYEVQDGPNIGYVTADGKFLIEGDLINLKDGSNLTENRRKADRVAKLAAFGEENMIVFAPEGRTKHVVTVFTDVDCGYCRKLHSEMAQYNAAGIEIRYLSYPRTGPNSESFRKAEAVWCSADRKAALTQAKLGAAVEGGEKCENVVEREWALGNEFGLRGTPLLVLEDGSVVNGYLPPAALAQRLDAGAAPAFGGPGQS
ncbi:DsbC family protein [Solimonas variicoloris]|uniref:DsbC family protein n=1 Tax=Solimonas variicoloris TaxID=254408 RepID=UPI0003789950|nr:DsbC family protein [Solimonas variicoloris]